MLVKVLENGAGRRRKAAGVKTCDGDPFTKTDSRPMSGREYGPQACQHGLVGQHDAAGPADAAKRELHHRLDAAPGVAPVPSPTSCSALGTLSQRRMAARPRTAPA